MPHDLTATDAAPRTVDGGERRIAVGAYVLRLDPDHGARVSPASPESPPAPAPAITTEDGSPRPAALPSAMDVETARQALAPLPAEEKRVLSALAAVGGGPVEGPHLAVLADVPAPLPVLDSLLAQRLIAAHSPRYSLADNLAALLPAVWDLSPWRERALAFFLPWAEARREDPPALLAEEGALRHLLDWTARAGRHAEAIRLGRALDVALAASGRWGAWGQALERVRDAAAALGDRAAEAWALHQLGTRLLCLGDEAEARPMLQCALAVRRSQGDRAGAAVTRHNLGLLSAANGGVVRASPVSFRLLPWLAAGLLLAVVGAVRFASSRLGEPLLPRGQAAAPVASGVPTPVREAETPEQQISDTAPEPTPPPLTGERPVETAVEGPRLEVPASLQFPDQAQGEIPGGPGETLLLRNAGSSPLRIAAMSFVDNPGQAFAMRSECARQAIPPGGQCLVQVFFHPPTAGSYRGVLAVDVAGLGRQSVAVSGTSKPAAEEPRRGRPRPGEPPAAPEPPVVAPVPVLGWCCLDGEVSRSSEDDCTAGRGAFFRGRHQATAGCLIDGCCVGGVFRLGESRERCDELGGTFMAAAEVPLRCQGP